MPDILPQTVHLQVFPGSLPPAGLPAPGLARARGPLPGQAGAVQKGQAAGGGGVHERHAAGGGGLQDGKIAGGGGVQEGQAAGGGGVQEGKAAGGGRVQEAPLHHHQLPRAGRDTQPRQDHHRWALLRTQVSAVKEEEGREVGCTQATQGDATGRNAGRSYKGR